MPRLYARVYLHLLGVLLVVGLATTAIFALGGRNPLLREAAHRVARHASALVGEELADPARLDRRLRQLHEDLGVDLRLRTLEGRELARAGALVPSLGPEDRARAHAGPVVVRVRRGWVLAAPVRDPTTGAVVALLEASGPAPLHHEPRPFGPLMVVAVVLGAVALAAAPLARRISRPLERLTAAARRLGTGDLSARVPSPERRGARWSWQRRPDEIEELRHTFNEMAERLERLLAGQKELLANVSHELRSPLARIRVALELLPRTGDADTRIRDLETDLAELDRLIDDVLAASRLEATGLPPHPAPVELGSLLAEVAQRAGQDPLTASAEVRVTPGPPVEIMADAALLRRALWNLVENAVKYGAPPVHLSVEPGGDEVRLCVSDRGPGIAPAERERVLEPFYRVDRARTPGGSGDPRRGFGLGLALARRIAQVHGGSIAIGAERTPDGRERGCRVVIALPARRVSPTPGPAPA